MSPTSLARVIVTELQLFLLHIRVLIRQLGARVPSSGGSRIWEGEGYNNEGVATGGAEQ